ncbi:MAG: DUF4390 domain-containing protein [Burkholderiales bacterium]
MLRNLLLAVLLLCALHSAAWSQAVLENLKLSRAEEGLRLAYRVRLELPKLVDEALHKGVPLWFVAEAKVSRSRWYWRDATVARSARQWRLSYQPLTRQYRLSNGGLHQTYESLSEALVAIGRASGWLLELREEPQTDGSYELAFNLRLDTTQLPGPLQIGLGPGAQLSLSREQAVGVQDLLLPALAPAATPTAPG